MGAAPYFATVSLIFVPLLSKVPATAPCLSTVVRFLADFLRLTVPTAQLARLTAVRAYLSLRPVSLGTTH